MFVKSRKYQVGIEYLMIVGFVTFVVIGILAIAYFYTGKSKDSVNLNQAESAVNEIISSAESIFYAGEPSKATITVYFPDSINNITVNGNEIIMELHTSSGDTKRVFQSKVQLEGNIPYSQGTRKIVLVAKQDKVEIS